jgi:hypothetical protein
MEVNLPPYSSFERLGQIIGENEALGFHGWTLRVRTVAFKCDGDWVNYATVAQLDEGATVGDKTTIIRDSVALFDFRMPIAGPLDTHQLTETLTHWRTALKLPLSTTFHSQVQVTRRASDIPAKSWPGWLSRLGTKQGYMQKSLPFGPFHDPRTRLFGSDLGMLAMHFLEDSRFAGHTNPSNEYELRVPDRRARIHSLKIEDNILHMKMENPARMKLFWSVVATPFKGSIVQIGCETGEELAKVALPFVAQKLEVWLILDDGYWIDRYEETPHYTTWGDSPSLFAAARSAEQKEILKTISRGETDTVEFKSYIQLRPQRNEKSFQILRSVSALANAAGGSLYLGVNDEAEPVGVEASLQRDYGPNYPELSQRLAAYQKDVSKLINEGTAPTIGIDYVWHEVALRQILEIRVPVSSQVVYLLEKGEMYRRKGGTNHKLRPVEAAGSGTPPANPFGQ